MSYANVDAIFEKYCIKCHSGEKRKGELVLTDHGSLMNGGESGSVITPGDASNSLLIRLVEHRKKPFMPVGKRSKRPTRREVMVLRAWIDAGAKR